MRYYPINLDVAGRGCVVIGGGPVAERKTLTLLSAGAIVTLISPEATDGLRKLAADGRLDWRQRCWQAGDLAGCFMAVCATSQQAVNAAAAAEGRQLGVLVNVADNPELSDFTLPALVSRGDLLIAVSTGGGSPMLARRIREQIEQQYNEHFGCYLQELAAIREQMKNCLPAAADREGFWRLALDTETLDLVRQGNLGEAKEKILREAFGVRNQS